MKCIKCGKKSKKTLCTNCFKEENSALDSLKQFVFLYCVNCGAYSYGKKYRTPLKLKQAILRSIKDNTKFNTKPEKFDIEFIPPKNIVKKTKINTEVLVKTISKIKGVMIEEEFMVPMRLRFTICDRCSKKRTTYFEGIVQLRNTNNKSFNDAIEFIKNETDKQKKKSIFITSEKKVKGGVDFYLTHQKYVQQLAQKTYQKFGGTLKINPHIFTRDRQTSKDVYRINALVKLPVYNKRDIIKIKNKLIQINNCKGKFIEGLDLTNNKKTKLEYKEDYEIIANSKDIKEVVVSKHYPKLEVLHPETYESIKVENPIKTKKGKIKVLEVEKKIYYIK